MNNKIDRLFAAPGRSLLMTHLVAGFPSPAGSLELAEALIAAGTDLLEIQIPFSDPLADGPTVMTANQQALAAGTVPADAFALVKALSEKHRLPLLLMTYANIPFQMSWPRFAAACAQAGASGVIIPDLPWDEPGQYLRPALAESGLYCVEVVSPGMSAARLATVCAAAAGFIYATLRAGTTGTGLRIAPEGLALLQQLKSISSLPVAAGFGISSPGHLDLLRGRAEAVVIGSRIIQAYQSGGIESVSTFISLCHDRLAADQALTAE